MHTFYLASHVASILWQVLLGNKDRNTIVGSILNPSIIARYLRIHPREYYIWMSLRFELYGCTSG